MLERQNVNVTYEDSKGHLHDQAGICTTEQCQHSAGDARPATTGQPQHQVHSVFGADNKTFIHTAFFRSEEDQKKLFELPSFQRFQEQLKASIPEVPPKNELLTLIGSSYSIF